MDEILDKKLKEEPKWDISVIKSEDASLNYSLQSNENSVTMKKKNVNK